MLFAIEQFISEMNILDKLQTVNDAVLEDVLELLEFETNTGIYKVSDLEREAISIGLQQIEDEQTISHEEVLKEINELLKKYSGQERQEMIK